MCGAEKHEDDFDPEAYTCPDQTTGHFSGAARRILTRRFAARSRYQHCARVIELVERADFFDVPYKIARFFYHVDGPLNENGEGRPKLLWLKDYNGDGEALEFALFDANNCTIVETTLFGYSKSQDRVIQYPIHLVQRRDDRYGAQFALAGSPVTSEAHQAGVLEMAVSISRGWPDALRGQVQSIQRDV